MARAHLVKAYDADLDALGDLVLAMGGGAAVALTAALAALGDGDGEAALRVIGDDARLDALEEDLDQRAVRLLALRQPMAEDLRLIAMSLEISNDLERIGDYAADVAKRARRLGAVPPPRVCARLRRVGQHLQAMLTDVLDAYGPRDARTAMPVWRRDREVDDIYADVFREL